MEIMFFAFQFLIRCLCTIRDIAITFFIAVNKNREIPLDIL